MAEGTVLSRPAEIPAEARHLLREKNFAHVATLMEDGAPQVSPVWIDEEDGLILFNTAAGRFKERNLRRDPRVAVSITDSENPYEGLLVRGHVVQITEAGARQHIDRLAKRYRGLDRYPSEAGEERLIVRILPERVRYMNP